MSGEREVAYVRQREAWDCGVASLAMAAGVSYEDALAVVPESQRGDLLNTVHFTQWLGALGCAVRKTYADQDDLRGIRLLCHNGHFVVRRPDGKVNDPARGEGREPYFYRNPFDVWEVHRLVPAAALSQAGEPPSVQVAIALMGDCWLARHLDTPEKLRDHYIEFGKQEALVQAAPGREAYWLIEVNADDRGVEWLHKVNHGSDYAPDWRPLLTPRASDAVRFPTKEEAEKFARTLTWGLMRWSATEHLDIPLPAPEDAGRREAVGALAAWQRLNTRLSHAPQCTAGQWRDGRQDESCDCGYRADALAVEAFLRAAAAGETRERKAGDLKRVIGAVAVEVAANNISSAKAGELIAEFAAGTDGVEAFLEKHDLWTVLDDEYEEEEARTPLADPTHPGQLAAWFAARLRCVFPTNAEMDDGHYFDGIGDRLAAGVHAAYNASRGASSGATREGA